MGVVLLRIGALALAAAMVAGAAQARDECDLASYGSNATVRDRSGHIVGTINGSAGDGTFRDGRGRVVGTSATSSTGITTYRDDVGRMIGTRNVSGSGEVVYRDGDGRIVDLPVPPFSDFCPPN